MEISVCIATRGRPAGLETLLSSLVAQRDAPAFEVIVVDNDPAGSARAVAARFTDRLAMTYATEATPGVSSARNRSVALSSAPLLAFIDDDERAEPGWLAALNAKMSDPTVAAAVGVVHFIFAEDVPIHRRECALYKVLDFEDGQDLEWWGTWIGNSCLRRSRLPDPVAPFDPSLNLIGGEDSHLFAAMIAKGARVVAARHALTYEYRSADRMRLRDILARTFRGAGTSIEIDWNTRPVGSRVRYAIVSAVRGPLNLLVAMLAWFPAPTFALRRLVMATTWAGRLARLAGWHYKEYRKAG
jgi:glycosyltransferase involved in cell wall biosynthesis